MADTLAERSWPSTSTATALSAKSLWRATSLAVLGSLLIALCAHIKVPMWPVPMTMQTFAVLLIGIAYGPRLGLATITLYLAEGASGLPVFAVGGGLAYFAGPTGGYLVGFALAGIAVGALARRGWDKSVPHAFAAMVLGTLLIYIPGAAWLGSIIGYEKAVTVGVLPFLAGDLIKAGLGAMLLPFAHKLLDLFRS